jgi:hypothetical protein
MDQHGSKRAGTRCRTFAAIAVHLQLHVLAYNLRMFLWTSAIPKMAELREWLITIGAKVVSHGRYVTLQMAEVAVSRRVFADVLSMISLCGHRKDRATA